MTQPSHAKATCREPLNLNNVILHWCRLAPDHDGMHEAEWQGIARGFVVQWMTPEVPEKGVALRIVPATSLNEV